MLLETTSPLWLTLFGLGAFTVLVNFLLKILFFSSVTSKNDRRYHWPPGPSRLKSLLQLRTPNNADVMQVLDKWPDRYGELMSIWFGRQRCVLLNSSRSVQESLVKRSDDFKGRETIELNWLSGLLTLDGPQWEKNRKQTVRLLYKYGMNIHQLESAMVEELNNLFRLWDRLENKPFEPRELFRTFSFNINAHAVCSERAPYALQQADDAREEGGATTFTSASETKATIDFVGICQLVREIVLINNEGIYAHWYPLRKWLPAYARHKRRIMTARAELFDRVRGMVQQHKQQLNVDEPRDLVDRFCIDIVSAPEAEQDATEINCVKALTDVIIAIVETMPNVVHWLMYFLVVNRHVQQKIYSEVRSVFGDADDNDEAAGADTSNGGKLDRYASLHYTRATIAEAMRCSNMFNTIVSHVAVRDTKIFDYDIPCGTPCILNLHHINYSEKEFDKPEEYRPDRFLDSQTGRYSKPKNFLMFGAGARACIGEDFAFKELIFTVARVVLRYELLAPDGYAMPSHLEPLSQGNFFCRDYYMCVRRRRRLTGA